MQTEKQSIYRVLNYTDLGLIDYKEAWDLQKETAAARLKYDTGDFFFMLEHPHTYTLGKTADKNNLISSGEYLKSRGISVYDIDRGGDITYHGPGQIVGYPVIHLSEWQEDLHEYLRAIEQVIIDTCADYGLDTGRRENYTGVWLNERKIAAIGIKVSRWITMHGFAFNVNTDLELFNGIIPCGIRDKEVTSLQKELGREMDIQEVKSKLLEKFISVFEYEKVIIKNYGEKHDGATAETKRT